MGGILPAVGGLVSLRAALTPSPGQALASPGLAAPVNGAATSSPSGPSRLRQQHSSATRRPSSRVPSAHPARQFLGDPFDVHYGIVQVRVTLDGARITGVSPVSLPEGGRSGDISRYAAPQLLREALTAQSAHIDTVSGASYTSAGYAESLQSALDKAGS